MVSAIGPPFFNHQLVFDPASELKNHEKLLGGPQLARCWVGACSGEASKARIVSGEETTKQMRYRMALTGEFSRSRTCAILAEHYSLRAVELGGRSPVPANGEGAEQLRNRIADSKALEEHRRGKER